MMMAATTMTMMTTEMTDGKRYMKLRHEQKHQISRMEDLVLAGRLSKLFERDSHAGPDGSYRVTSLYFDTPYDKALREKMDGISRREKFRLRYYGTDVSYIRLEKKFKIGGMCGKRSQRISRDQAQALLAVNWRFLRRMSRCCWNSTVKSRGSSFVPKRWYAMTGRRFSLNRET